MKSNKHILKFEEVGIKDVPIVGGKNASLGEMIRTLSSKGIPVPSGFVVTAPAYFYFLKETGLDVLIKSTLKGLDAKTSRSWSGKRGKFIREAMVRAEFPADLTEEMIKGYRELEKRIREERRCSSALQRDGGRSARRQFRRRAGKLSRHTRRERGPCRRARDDGVALHRPGHLIPRRPRI